MRKDKDLFTWLGRVIVLAYVATFIVLIPMVWLQGCGDDVNSPGLRPLPVPFFTSNAGQKWVAVPAKDLEWWLVNHKNAKVISVAAPQHHKYVIVYEESGGE